MANNDVNINTIENINTATTITSSNSATVNENQTTAITITATDVDGDTLIYSISGTDASSFNIDSSTGVVTFKNTPDYETKNSYSFIVTVSDGVNEVSKDIIVNISDTYEEITPPSTDNYSGLEFLPPVFPEL